MNPKRTHSQTCLCFASHNTYNVGTQFRCAWIKLISLCVVCCKLCVYVWIAMPRWKCTHCRRMMNGNTNGIYIYRIEMPFSKGQCQFVQPPGPDNKPMSACASDSMLLLSLNYIKISGIVSDFLSCFPHVSHMPADIVASFQIYTARHGRVYDFGIILNLNVNMFDDLRTHPLSLSHSISPSLTLSRTRSPAFAII